MKKLSDMQHSLIMLDVARIVSSNNEQGIGTFTLPVDDD